MDRRVVLGWVLAVGLVVLAVVLVGRNEPTPVTASPLMAVPEKSLRGLHLLDGAAFELTAYRGRPLLVNFWATWCPPCREEMPLLVALQQKYQKQGLQVLALNYMESPDPQRLRNFALKQRLNFSIVYGDSQSMARLGQELGGLQGLPTSFLLDREGRVVDLWTGALSEALLERWMKKVL
ncbi:MAG: TlpA family protein disulfide reductase [Magnetococcus sp. WYHC-3]